MENKPLIVVDVDEVLLHYIQPFLSYCKSLGWEVCPNSEQDSYDMTSWFSEHDIWGVMTRDELVCLINEFNDYPRALPPLEWSQDMLHDIKYSADIIALSSFGGTEQTKQFRKDYLNVLYPDVFKDIILIGLGECKKKYLEELKPDIYVEDSLQHATSAKELGIKCILIETPYNKGCDTSHYTKDWLDAACKIMNTLEMIDV